MGGEFRVNADVGVAYTPSIAALADGGFVVCWQGQGDYIGNDIVAQRYGADGAKSGAEFRINAAAGAGHYEEAPSIAALADGGFAVSWHHQDGEGAHEVYVRRFAADGAAVGGEFLIADVGGGEFGYGGFGYPSIAALADGGFVVSWDRFADDGTYDVFAQRYAAGGAAVGGEFRVNATVASHQFDSTVVALADGGFVVSWYGFADSTFSFDVFAQRYTADGAAAGGEVHVTAGYENQYAPSVAALANGGFVATWFTDHTDYDADVYARLFDVPAPDMPAQPNGVRIAPVMPAKAEGDRGSTDFVFNVSLDHASSTAQSVQWRVEKHGADPAKPKDFAGAGFPSGEVVFAPGETEKAITIRVAGDTAVESDETFAVVLRKPSDGLAIGDAGTAVATILDDDLPAFASRDCAAKVARLYEAALDRSADRGGFEFWVDALGKGEALSSLASCFLASGEFAARFGHAASTDDAFVGRLYQNVLGRAGEAQGHGFWRASLEKGVSRDEVLAAFSESAEHVALAAARLEDGSGLLIA